MPGPGRDAWLAIDRAGGTVEYERTDRGWVSYLNDLHKGRNAGPAWGWFIDVFALACVVFTVTGLLLLQMHARQRPTTWPWVGLGLVVPRSAGWRSTAPAAPSSTSAPTAAGCPTSTTCTRAATPARPGAGSSTSSRWPASCSP